ncbi:TPA: Vir protein [Legionella pneumophila]|nr:Vir protein [Legionella pneumophila]
MSSTSVKPEANDKRIDTLFTRLGAIYGHVWWSSYKSESLLNLAKKEWSEGLARFNNASLKEALFYFRENSNFPPTLPQFIERCKASVRRNNFCSAKSELQQRIDTKIALKHIQDLYALLKH